MIPEYNIGDIVEIRADHFYQMRSEGTSGKIIELYNKEKFYYRILWGNGFCDVYDDRHVQLVRRITPLCNKEASLQLYR